MTDEAQMDEGGMEVGREDVRQDLLTEIRTWDVDRILRELPEVYERIAAAVHDGQVANLSEKGFLLGVEDPYAAGALRTYAKAIRRPDLRLPFVLPFGKTKAATRAALQDYVLRARGSGDRKRAAPAESALDKMK